jgi:hypothetical protein
MGREPWSWRLGKPSGPPSGTGDGGDSEVAAVDEREDTDGSSGARRLGLPLLDSSGRFEGALGLTPTHPLRAMNICGFIHIHINVCEFRLIRKTVIPILLAYETVCWTRAGNLGVGDSANLVAPPSDTGDVGDFEAATLDFAHTHTRTHAHTHTRTHARTHAGTTQHNFPVRVPHATSNHYQHQEIHNFHPPDLRSLDG